MEIRTLKGIHINELLLCFNESFSDYLVPLQLNLDQLLAKIRSDRVDLQYSAGAFMENRLVGFILHGIDRIGDKKVAYNAGTGVIPSQRGQGLTRRMYDFILPVLKAENVDHILLEVIGENLPAIKTYERIGFKPLRKLLCYRGEIHAEINEKITVKELSGFDWEALKKFWDFLPSWQNAIAAVEMVRDTNKTYGARINGRLAGYIIYNPISKRVQQFGVDTRYRRRKAASTLFDFVGEPGSRITVINVDENSVATQKFLMDIGLEKFTEQVEMKLDLDQAHRQIRK